MTAEITRRYPLLWPPGRPRERSDKPALFRQEGRALTGLRAEQRLAEQLRAMTRTGKPWRTANCILASNRRLTSTGALHGSERRDPYDVGVAFYFDLDRRPHVLACDRWNTVADNIAAIAAHIEALRGQERWGVANLEQAFAGHVALPAPRTWREVLGLSGAVTAEDVDRAFREKAKSAHPDRTGSDEAMQELNSARAEAKAFLT